MNVNAWWKNRAPVAEARNQLQAEVDLNLQLLQEFWKRVKPRKSDEESHRVDKVRYASEFALTDLPPFSRQVYDSQQATLAQMLSTEQQARFGQVYEGLARLAEIQRELREKRDRDIAAHAVPEASMSPAYEEFRRAAPWLWMEAKRLIQDLLAR